MKISLVTPMARRYCVWELLQTVKALFHNNPTVTFFWVINDNSNSVPFGKMIAKQKELFLEQFKNIQDVVIREDKEPWLECNVKGVADRIQDVYNSCYALCPNDSDYGMSIEDDISLYHPEALRMMLAAFDDTTATVMAPTFARRLNVPFYVPPQVWKAGKLPPDVADVKESGTTVEDYTGQTYWISRWSLIKQLPFEWTYKGLNGNDRTWGMKVKELGYVTKVVWDLKPKHWYMTKEGIMGFSSAGVAKRMKDLRAAVMKNPIIQTERKSSPQFTNILKYDASRWGWSYWLKGEAK